MNTFTTIFKKTREKRDGLAFLRVLTVIMALGAVVLISSCGIMDSIDCLLKSGLEIGIPDYLTAIGTLLLAILAILAPQTLAKLVPPKLSIVVSQDLLGILTDMHNGQRVQRVMYYLLKVKNAHPWSAAKNCRVLLTGISKRRPNGDFQPLIPPVIPHQCQFTWSPAEVTPRPIDVSTDQVFDFGRVVEGEDRFTPVLNWYPSNFQGYVSPNEVLRYTLEISADGYSAKRCQTFQVSWDGQWDDNRERMGQHLVVEEVKGLGGK
ncbi:MAG: hypothetical protein MdMp014T_0159 [Treponematales bacterium]